MGAQYNSTAPTLPDKARTPLQTDANGNLKVAGLTGTSATQVQGPAANDAAAVGNPVLAGGIYQNADAVDLGDVGSLQIGPYGALKVQLFDGTASAISAVSINGALAGNEYGITAAVVAKPATAGGLTAARVVTGTSGVIKASAGQLYKLHSVRNANAAVRYLHLYDKATAPTLSTDTPVLTISLAASSVQNDINIGGDLGVTFANGISWAYTTDNIAIPATAGTSTELMFSGAYK